MRWISGFFNAEIKKDTLALDILSKGDAALVIMGVDPAHYEKWERMKDLSTPYTDIDDSGLTWRQKEEHLLFQIFLECHAFIESLLDSAIACDGVKSFSVNGETRLRLKDVVEWAQAKDIPLSNELLEALNPSTSISESKKTIIETRTINSIQLPIEVNRTIARNKGGGATEQMRNTIIENETASRDVQQLMKGGMSRLDIANNMKGGKKVIACLLYSDRPTPEAAYRALLKEQNKINRKK